MELDYLHPDHLLRSLTSSQLAGWLSYCRLMKIGPPLPADPDAERKQQRMKFEDGMRNMMNKGQHNAER